MKLLHYIGSGLPHPKNHEAIQRMCLACSIEYEETAMMDRLQQPNYDILLSCFSYIEPSQLPPHVKVILGPQFFIFPDERIIGPPLASMNGRWVYNCLSEWIIKTFHEFGSEFKMPLVALPFGVNTQRFQPRSEDQHPSLDCIIYVKRRSKALIEYTLQLVHEKGFTYQLFEYGSYQEEEYRNGLQNAKFMMVLDAHESQGFALEEAMSCNVPLLVVDATSMYEETNDGVKPTYESMRPKKLEATSVPYWCEECGIKLRNTAELSNALNYMIANYRIFTPRKFVLGTLSDEVCMKRILGWFYDELKK
jgi:hypothetical protein